MVIREDPARRVDDHAGAAAARTLDPLDADRDHRRSHLRDQRLQSTLHVARPGEVARTLVVGLDPPGTGAGEHEGDGRERRQDSLERDMHAQKIVGWPLTCKGHLVRGLLRGLER